MITTSGAAVMAPQASVLELANTPVLWICAIGVFSVILVQSWVYFRAAKSAAPAAGMSEKDISTAFKVGAIAAIGPSMAVVLVAIALLSVFGTPAVLVRIGLVGSAAYETGAASVGAATVGAKLAGPTYTPDTFALVFTAITFGGIFWMIATLIFTPILKRGDSKLRQVDPTLMVVVPVAAMTAAFAALGFGTFKGGFPNVLAFFMAALLMVVLMLIANKFNLLWLKDWALGIVITISLAVLILAF